ncbi:MAG TPA: ComEC/Rec2 family competence protein [bacterium]|nr:ComEC/Rec2 family competence protein [bacterium]
MSRTHDVTIVPARPGLFSREWLTVLIVVLAAAAAWIIAWKQIDGTAAEQPAYQVAQRIKELEVTFIDVGQGDSSFIRMPNGRTILVDAGPSKGMYSTYDAGEQAVIPFLQQKGIARIDTLMMTHPHADHYGGMQALLNSGIEIGEFLDPGMDHPTQSYRTLLETVGRLGIPFREIRAPNTLNWDSDVLVQVIWPEEGFSADNPNNASIVFRLVYGDVVYLFAGDAEAVVEGVLNAYGPGLRTTVLKVPHHGSDTSSTRSFMEYVIPRLAVISVGNNNRFNHPNPDIMDRYDRMNIPVLRTDKSGTITTKSDGTVVRVTPEMGAPFEIYPFPPAPVASSATHPGPGNGSDPGKDGR